VLPAGFELKVESLTPSAPRRASGVCRASVAPVCPLEALRNSSYVTLHVEVQIRSTVHMVTSRTHLRRRGTLLSGLWRMHQWPLCPDAAAGLPAYGTPMPNCNIGTAPPPEAPWLPCKPAAVGAGPKPG